MFYIYLHIVFIIFFFYFIRFKQHPQLELRRLGLKVMFKRPGQMNQQPQLLLPLPPLPPLHLLMAKLQLLQLVHRMIGLQLLVQQQVPLHGEVLLKTGLPK